MASKPPRPQQQQQHRHHQPNGLPVRRDRPWLLPTNRKLRNLLSVSLRNLSLTPSTPSRPRGKTFDDDAVPHSLKSPAKLLALREQKGLIHSQSSSDLRSVSENAVVDGSADKGDDEGDGSPAKSARLANGAPKTPQRPLQGRMRRRSTLEWANATPQTRQERLEGVTRERMADVFVSIHVEGVEEPVYVSEVVKKSMNPTFRHVDWSACGPGITRMERMTLRFWVQSDTMRGWRQLLELSLNLNSLQYLGRSLDQSPHALPHNAVIFHLSDGVYTSFPSLSDYLPPPMGTLARTMTNRILPSSSFDTLLRLSKLDDSIQDALITRNKIASDLETLLESNKKALTERDRVVEAEDRLKTIEFAKKTLEKQLEKARKQQDEKRLSIQTRRELMSRDLRARRLKSDEMTTEQPELPGLRDEREVKRNTTSNQRRRICEDLHHIYPLTPIQGKSLAFTIRGLHLPNSDDLDAGPPDSVSAALGNVAHTVLMLAYYLDQPLPYPVNPKSSTSTVEDSISLLKTTSSTTQSYKDEKALRTYPLFSKGVPRFRFEYGVFLLNKNLQILLESAFGVRVLDLRQTLPNLKYLLYVATAGEGELPARKAGGVRGLMAGRVGGTPDGSRAGSQDSRGSEAGPEKVANGTSRGAVDSLRRNIGGPDRGRRGR